MSEAEKKPEAQPGRERETDRAEAVQTERRRRKAGVSGDGVQTKMQVPPDLYEPEKYVYRWANDDRMRIHNLTVNDDYEVVLATGKAGKAGDASAVRYRVGNKEDGAPMYAYLLRKLKVHDEADRSERIAEIDKREKERLSAKAPDDAPEKSYTPKR